MVKGGPSFVSNRISQDTAYTQQLKSLQKQDCDLVKTTILFWKGNQIWIALSQGGAYNLRGAHFCCQGDANGQRGVHFERLGALTNRNLDRTKYLFYNIDLFVLRPRILLNYRKEQGLMH